MPFSSCHPCQSRCQSSYAAVPWPRRVFYTVQCGHQEGPLELQQFDKVFHNAVCAHYTSTTPTEHTASLHSGPSKMHQYHRRVCGQL
jgi:hypothetical protein